MFAVMMTGCSTSSGAAIDASLVDTFESGDAVIIDGGIESGDAIDCHVYWTQIDTGLPDGELGCEYSFPCGLPEIYENVGCDLYLSGTDPLDARALRCWIVDKKNCVDGSVRDAGLLVDCLECGSGGRGSSHIEPAAIEGTGVGAYFARMAHEEAASVYAFERLARELAHHRAPDALVRHAKSAARDETKHARMMSRLARAHGALPPNVRTRLEGGPRPLEAIALENAIEGCVRETCGAFDAAWLAKHGPRAFRKTFAIVAKDELRHAALAWAIARWSLPMLDDRSRHDVVATIRNGLARKRRTSMLRAV
jgi:hypothetical protein